MEAWPYTIIIRGIQSLLGADSFGQNIFNSSTFLFLQDVLSEPRLILKQNGGGYIVLPDSVFISIDTSARKLGVNIPKINLPDSAVRFDSDTVELLFQPNPREQRTVQGLVKIGETINEEGLPCVVIKVTLLTA